MQEHFVQSHLGGYYISNMEKEKIEAYCEACGDHDCVLASWDNKKDKLKKLTPFFYNTTIKEKSDVDITIEEYDDGDSTKEEMIDYIIYILGQDKYDKQNTLDELYESKDLTEEEYKKLKQINITSYIKELNIIKDYIRNNNLIRKDIKKLKLKK